MRENDVSLIVLRFCWIRNARPKHTIQAATDKDTTIRTTDPPGFDVALRHDALTLPK